MKYIEIIANAKSANTVSAIADKAKVQDFRLGVVGEDGMQQMWLLLSDEKLQAVLDSLQNILKAEPTARVVVLAVEMSLPQPEEKKRQQEDGATAAREALYEGVEKGVRLDINFMILVVLAALVASVGLMKNNVAVVIGAMVIAPLLAPNLALSLGSAIGDLSLIRKSIQTLGSGILLSIAVSAGLGLFWPADMNSHELISRTNVGLDSAVLALASGAAAALSLTTGLSSVLVGVMVAVALLPPAVAMGLMLGSGHMTLAAGAGLLLLVNVVSVNLASKIVFDIKGIRPRTYAEKGKARHAQMVYILGWLVSLGVLFLLIYIRR
ncbi:MAG: TIGR00341 family protein [Campylobacterales bacterium]|nr:TIGR00341 family protein [Campylobacterales bacterium]